MDESKEQKKLLKAQKKAEKLAKLESKKNNLKVEAPAKIKKPVSNSGYNPTDVEKFWTEYWTKNQCFLPQQKEKKFCMVIPPPNITGSLHIGHAMMISIEDSIARFKRLTGHEVLYLPGLDHAGIATQNVVMKSLGKSVDRDTFLKAAFEWSDKYGHRIYEQFDRMGTSLDYSRKVFTLDKNVNRSVNTAFCTLYRKGLIYRDTKIVNWCGKLHTTLSDLEVNYKSIEGGTYLDVDGGRYKFGMLYYIKYYLTRSRNFDISKIHELPYVVIGTTRPETILGDSAICINPNDQRFKDLDHIFREGKVEDLFNESYKAENMISQSNNKSNSALEANADDLEMKIERKNKFKVNKNVQPDIIQTEYTLFAINPLTHETIPVIFDNQAELEFGTGILKVTPFHDPVDFKLGKKHNLKFNCILDEHNKISHSMFKEMPRFEARKAVIEKLSSTGFFVKEEVHDQVLPFCSRSNDLIESVAKEQWWCDCKGMAQKALDGVKTQDIKIYPEEATSIWNRWLENIKDWCLSRQLWWGHRIPAYKAVNPNSEIYEWIVAETEEEAKSIATEKGFESIIQDDDVLDTWFSSGLWPFSTLGWPDETLDMQKYFPNSLLETGSDILFFWVARMVMLSYELTGKRPFDKILLHGIVRDAHGRKMSKSLGNVIDPLYVIEGINLSDMIDNLQKGNLDPREVRRASDALKKDFPNGIPKCGADALRFALLSYSNGMNDVNLDILRVQGYARLCNKVYNAFKFVQKTNSAFTHTNQQEDGYEFEKIVEMIAKLRVQQTELKDHHKWILSKMNSTIKTQHECFDKFKFMEATKSVYELIYDFCDNIIEVSKTPSSTDIFIINYVFNGILTILNPFMPFITEDLHFKLNGKLVSEYPVEYEGDLSNSFDDVLEVVKICRTNEDIEIETFENEFYLSLLLKNQVKIVDNLKEYSQVGHIKYKIN